MVSFDVKSLFASIPVDLTLTITNETGGLQKDQDLAEHTNMSSEQQNAIALVRLISEFTFDLIP